MGNRHCKEHRQAVFKDLLSDLPWARDGVQMLDEDEGYRRGYMCRGWGSNPFLKESKTRSNAYINDGGSIPPMPTLFGPLAQMVRAGAS